MPWYSNVAIAGDVAAARAKAEKDGVPPRDAWMMQCVQEDPTNPQPCTPEDRAKYPGGQMPTPVGGEAGADDTDNGADIDAGCNPDFGPCPTADAGAH